MKDDRSRAHVRGWWKVYIGRNSAVACVHIINTNAHIYPNRKPALKPGHPVACGHRKDSHIIEYEFTYEVSVVVHVPKLPDSDGCSAASAWPECHFMIIILFLGTQKKLNGTIGI